MREAAEHDLIIAGGGLAGSLLAWRLLQLQPEANVVVLEAGGRLGGNHTWSFFESDLSAAQNAWMEPLVCHSWPGYAVRFPKRDRELSSGYRSITSDRLHDIVASRLGTRIIPNATVAEVNERGVRLADGRHLTAACVIDARGDRKNRHLLLGYQKFLGLELQTSRPHGLMMPVIMDATVAQNDGYRFVYTLPLSGDRLLIEDTYYSDGGALLPAMLRDQITQYAKVQGWQIASIVREEHGVLPIILAGDIDALLSENANGAPRIGLGAGLFHPTTGYSLPDAVRMADRLATTRPLTTATARDAIHAYVRETWQQRGFFRLLNRMLFRAGEPSQRYSILERFYGLDSTLIQHFYAAKLTAAEKARILVGKPPVPLREALRCMSEQAMLRKSRGLDVSAK